MAVSILDLECELAWISMEYHNAFVFKFSVHSSPALEGMSFFGNILCRLLVPGGFSSRAGAEDWHGLELLPVCTGACTILQ